jgi:hypothetical protein
MSKTADSLASIDTKPPSDQYFGAVIFMEKSDDTPLWVFLAFSSIETRKGALLLLWASLIFSIYSFPWVLFFADSGWVATLFLIGDWSWIAMMAPVMLWYWLSLRWVDRNSGWPSPALD